MTRRVITTVTTVTTVSEVQVKREEWVGESWILTLQIAANAVQVSAWYPAVLHCTGMYYNVPGMALLLQVSNCPSPRR